MKRKVFLRWFLLIVAIFLLALAAWSILVLAGYNIRDRR